MDAPGRPLTKKEVADKLNVSEKTVSRMVARGEFPRPRYLGGAPRWFDEDVVIYLCRLRRGEVGTTPTPESAKKPKRAVPKTGQTGTNADS